MALAERIIKKIPECAGRKRLCPEECSGFFQEQIQLIMMDPVPCLGDLYDAVIGDGGHPGIVFRNRGKAFQSPEDQRGRGDPSVEFHGVLDVVAVR